MQVLDLGAQRAAEQRNKALATQTLNSEEAKEHISPARSNRPRVWPHEGGRKVLDRPFKETSGRRLVPKLINANKVPILQFKKPQSPFLSRMIRDIIKTRQKRVDLQHKLKEQVQWARREDAWDLELRKSLGLEQDQSEERWTYQPKLSHDQVQAHHAAAANKQVKIAAKMHAIVEKEKALAFEEKWEKHRMKTERRLDISQIEQTHSEEPGAKREPRHREEGIAKIKSEGIMSTGEEPEGRNFTDDEKAIDGPSRPEPKERQTMKQPTRGGRTKQQLQMENKVAEQESPLVREIIAKMRLKENLGRTGGHVERIIWTDDEKAEIKAARRQRKEEKAAKSAVRMEQLGEQGKYRQGNGKKMASPPPNRRQGKKTRRRPIFVLQRSQKSLSSGS